MKARKQASKELMASLQAIRAVQAALEDRAMSGGGGAAGGDGSAGGGENGAGHG
jgi:hypothetical protein